MISWVILCCQASVQVVAPKWQLLLPVGAATAARVSLRKGKPRAPLWGFSTLCLLFFRQRLEAPVSGFQGQYGGLRVLLPVPCPSWGSFSLSLPSPTFPMPYPCPKKPFSCPVVAHTTRQQHVLFHSAQGTALTSTGLAPVGGPLAVAQYAEAALG